MATFSFDYDNTWTLTDSVRKIAQKLREDGHTILIVTMRYPSEADAKFCGALKEVDGVVFTCREAKQSCLRRLGIGIDIWLDDCPEFILGNAAAEPRRENGLYLMGEMLRVFIEEKLRS